MASWGGWGIFLFESFVPVGFFVLISDDFRLILWFFVYSYLTLPPFVRKFYV
jgi:hypothetical protein